MNIDRTNRFRPRTIAGFWLCLAILGNGCSSNAKTGLSSSGGTTASGGNTAQGGSTVGGGRTGQGGTTAVGGTMVSGGTSTSGTGGASGSGGSQGVCSGRPSTCFALCQGGVGCECYCPSSGGAGGSSTAT